MRMGIGLGVGINRSNYAQGIFNAYSARVVADGGVVESGSCVDAVSSLLQSASLLLIPSGYKGGKLYAEIPTNGNGDLIWTRGGDAFRTNASGVIQRVPWNLLRYSEEFDNSAWTKASATVTANATTAPNGTLTADKVIATNTASTTRAIYQSFTPSSSQRFNFSVYAKASEYSRLALQEIGSGRFGASFDLSTQTTASLGGAGFVSSSITNVGNGWFLCSVVWDGLAGSGAALTTIGYPAGATISAAGTSYAGDGTSGIFIWGAQLVEGTTAQTYLPTTDRLNFPRLSYMYGSCPSALVEPQRTNLFLSSQQFTSTSWLTGGGGSAVFTDNFATSPDGTTNAARWTAAGSNYQTRQNVATINTTATLSVWMRSNSGTKSVTLFINDYTVSSTISVTTTWQRFSVTGAVGATLSGSGRCGFSNNSILTNTDYIEVFGAQYEVGAYPTTYIPTTSSTATRVADSFSRNNIYTNGLISASGGTWFVELRNNIGYTRDAAAFGLFIDSASGGITNGFSIRQRGTAGDRLSIQKQVAGTQTFLYLTTANTTKLAIKWNGTTADIFENGTKVVSATSFTPTAMEFLNASIADVPFFIQQMALFNTPLTDAQCQTLTT